VTHATSCSVATGFYSPVVKRPGFEVNQSPRSGAEVRKGDAISLLLYSSTLWIIKMLPSLVVYGPG
jgi:hypothetical protein